MGKPNLYAGSLENPSEIHKQVIFNPSIQLERILYLPVHVKPVIATYFYICQSSLPESSGKFIRLDHQCAFSSPEPLGPLNRRSLSTRTEWLVLRLRRLGGLSGSWGENDQCGEGIRYTCTIISSPDLPQHAKKRSGGETR